MEIFLRFISSIINQSINQCPTCYMDSAAPEFMGKSTDPVVLGIVLPVILLSYKLQAIGSCLGRNQYKDKDCNDSEQGS
jgi:hypothetical protein